MVGAAGGRHEVSGISTAMWVGRNNSMTII
jgi:hypothetical protein